jgi:hypothetical protein
MARAMCNERMRQLCRSQAGNSRKHFCALQVGLRVRSAQVSACFTFAELSSNGVIFGQRLREPKPWQPCPIINITLFMNCLTLLNIKSMRFTYRCRHFEEYPSFTLILSKRWLCLCQHNSLYKHKHRPVDTFTKHPATQISQYHVYLSR